MTVGILSRSDDFTRADGDIAGSTGTDGKVTWLGSTNIDVVSNQLKVITSTVGVVYDSSQQMANGWVEFVFKSGTGHGPMCRSNGSNSQVFAFMNGTVRIYDTAVGLLTTGSTSVSANSRVALYFHGSTIDLYIDDVLDGTTTTTITGAGYCGVYGEVANATADSWKVYASAGGVPSGPFSSGGFLASAFPKSAFQGSQ